jgi:hypothetical protein
MFWLLGQLWTRNCALTLRKLAARNVHLHGSKMRLCGLDLEILYARLKNSFAQNFPRDAQLQRFSCTNRISRWPKKNPHRIPNRPTKITLRPRIFGVWHQVNGRVVETRCLYNPDLTSFSVKKSLNPLVTSTYHLGHCSHFKSSCTISNYTLPTSLSLRTCRLIFRIFHCFV